MRPIANLDAQSKGAFHALLMNLFGFNQMNLPTYNRHCVSCLSDNLIYANWKNDKT